ncbi:MAG: AAA family ATPase [Actinomycetota bacterium]|nr:AAA family ATPase [Actinomycetota bacterium]
MSSAWRQANYAVPLSAAALATSGSGRPLQRSAELGPAVHSRLAERERLLSELAALLAPEAEPHLSAVVLEGRRGSGRSSVLDALAAAAGRRDWLVMRAAGSDLEATVRFGVLRQLFDSLGPSRAAIAHALRRLLDEEHDALADPAGPAVVGRAVDEALDELTATHALLVMLDDAQWSDPESAQALCHLAHHLGGRPIRLLVASTGAGEVSTLINRIALEPGAQHKSLLPLSPEGTRAMLAADLGRPPSDALVATCHELTGGLPGLLHALALELSRDSVPPTDPAVLRRFAPATTVREVRVQLAPLDRASRALLEALAVLGRQADALLVAEIAEIAPSAVSEAADALAELGLLRPERPLAFQVPLLRNAVYASIDAARRSALHARCARLLEQREATLEEIARHLLASDPTGDGWAVSILIGAARLAAKSGDVAAARADLQRALTELPEPAMRAELLLELARADAAVGERSALEDLRRARRAGAGATASVAAALDVLAALEDDPVAADVLAELEQVAAELPGDEAQLRVHVAAAEAMVSRSTAALRNAAEAVLPLLGEADLAPDGGDRVAAAVLGLSRCANGHGEASTVATLLRSALLGHDLADDNPLRLRLWARATMALAQCGEAAEAERVARSAQEAVGRLGPIALAEFSTALAVAYFVQGELPAAEAECTRALALTRKLAWSGRPLATAYRIATLTHQGRLAEAAAAVERCDAVDLVADTPERRVLLEQRAALLLAQGRFEDALSVVRDVSASAVRVDNPAVSPWRRIQAEALAALGRTAEAERVAQDEVLAARTVRSERALGAALRSLARHLPPNAQLQTLREALEHLDASKARLEHAATLVDLGVALHEAGAPIRMAREALREAADLALSCGATPLVTAAARALRATGARPRHLALSGVRSLTPSELRIAALAAQGHTNAEIADELCVNTKTVEGHLRSSYRKLNIRSRGQLRALLDNGATGPDASPAATRDS